MSADLNDKKIDVLLHALDFQVKEIQRRQEREQYLFQWMTSLLLAVFGALLALNGSIATIPYSALMRGLATLMIVLPVGFSVWWIFRLSRQATANAGVVERIEALLHLFDDAYYGAQSPYPAAWQDGLRANLSKRRTPVYYATVIGVMTVCVVASIWLIL